MTLEQLITFAIAMAIYVVTPGPGVMAVVARALADGMRPTIPHIAGIMLVNLAFLMASIYGLAWIASQMGQMFLAIKLIGGGYLIYLGIRLWRASGNINAMQTGRPKTALSTLFTGMSISASNPKVIIFYLALLPAVLDINAVSTQMLIEVVIVNQLVLLLVMGGYSALAAHVRRLFTDSGSVKKLNRGAGSLMIAAGVGVAAS